MSTAALTFRQVGFENRSFWRNPPAAFFTFVFPLMFLVIFNLIFGGDDIPIGRGRTISGSTFYVPAIAAFSVITACYTNIAISVATARDLGILKRVRGTPLPSSAYLLARVIHASVIALLLVGVVTLAGAAFYGVDAPTGDLPLFALTIVVGAAAFSALGLALTAVIPTAQAAPAVVNASILPLLFISNIFIPVNQAPEWLETFSKVFPVRHYADAMAASFVPDELGVEYVFDWTSLLVVAAWGIAGLALANRFFSWEPRR
ncbi:MAG TPA: ABC transporter permease [Actinomycetota bacterium]|nr:ABC transporter permease [Actinomycetota bacterium]